MDLNGNRFVLMCMLFRIFDDDRKLYKRGFSSKMSLSKVMSGSDNPKITIRCFVDECVSEGVLVFDSDGRLVLDDDRFMDVMSDSKVFVDMKNIFKNYATLFID